MKVCRVKPKIKCCRACLSSAERYGIIKSCSDCSCTYDEYELIGVGRGFLAKDYAFVCKNGTIKRVPLDRIFDIRNVDERPREKQVP